MVVRKWSVIVGSRGLSGFVARAVEHELQRDALAVDAMVVATAIRLGGGLILTHDPTDLRRLAAQPCQRPGGTRLTGSTP